MLLPTNIATGRVTGQFLAGVVDGVDDDQDPDAVPAAGFVTFTASVPYLPDPTASPNPATILTTSVVAVLDNEGYLCTPAQGTLEPSYRGVRLIATDDPDLSVEGWTWNATYSFSTVAGQKLAIPTHSFAVPSDGVVDLTTAVKVPSSTGIGTEQAEALAASAQAAAIQSAQDAATAAQAAVDAAGAAQVTDANISALVGNPATDTADAVTALVVTAAADKLNVDDAINTYQSQAALDAAAASKVSTGGTATNTAVKAIADAAAGPKLAAADLDAASAALVDNVASSWWAALVAKLKTLYVGKGDAYANVRDYGAKGDGVTDDRLAFQAARDTKKPVYVPASFDSFGFVSPYMISDPGLMVPTDRDFRMFGDGKTKSILKKFASDGSNNLEALLRETMVAGVASPARNVVVEHLGFEGNGDPAIKTAKASGLMRFYEVYGLRAISCAFYKGRGYGAGFEGATSSPNADRRGPSVDIFFQDCDFYSNGKIAYLTGTDTDDGIDFKTSDRATFVNCRAWDNGDKGYDIRARGLTMLGCHAWANAGAGFSAQVEGVQPGTTSIPAASATYVGCWSTNNGGAGFSITPQVTPGVVGGLQFVTYTACTAVNNLNNFSLGSQGTNDLAIVRLQINGCTSLDPVAGSRHIIGSAPAESLAISGGTYKGGTTTAISPNTAQTGPTIITGAVIENITGTAISLSTNTAARATITGNSFRTVSGSAISGTSNNMIAGNTYESVTGTPVTLTGTNNRVLDMHSGTRTVASAATLTLPETSDFIIVTGTTAITSIAPSWAQRRVTLRFTGVCTVTDGSALNLAGNYTTANNSMLSLICDGTNWYEVSRSAN